VTLHSFRHTHQTWALASEVPQHLINLQGGWAVSRSAESWDVKRVRESMTGQRRYLDAGSDLLDSTPSAVAVRELPTVGGPLTTGVGGPGPPTAH